MFTRAHSGISTATIMAGRRLALLFIVPLLLAGCDNVVIVESTGGCVSAQDAPSEASASEGDDRGRDGQGLIQDFRFRRQRTLLPIRGEFGHGMRKERPMAIDDSFSRLLECDRFPRSSGYDCEWVLQNQMGLHPLWLTEWLCQSLDMRPGMRILDLACGKAISSIFLAKEYGAHVWANNFWVETDENRQRIEASGVRDSVISIRTDARDLPFASEFFDVILCVDAFIYFGTDDLYLNYVHRFLKKGGQIAIAVPGLMKEFAGPVPKHLEPFWGQDCWTWHTVEWWRRHWARTGLVDVEVVDVLPEGHELWLRFEQALWDAGNHSDEQQSDIRVLTEDGGQYMGFVRAVARRR